MSENEHLSNGYDTMNIIFLFKNIAVVNEDQIAGNIELTNIPDFYFLFSMPMDDVTTL